MARPDRIAEALARLDPEPRALVELSARRGMSDAEIAEIVGGEPADIARRRDDAVDDMARELDTDADELYDQLPQLEDEHWTAKPKRRPAVTPLRPGARRRSRVPALLALAAVLLIVLIVVIASSGGDDEESTGAGSTQAERTTGTTEKPKTTPTKPGKPASPGTGAVRFQRLNGTFGRGTAQIDGRHLKLNVSGFLKPNGGGYAVWLYTSSDDNRRLYATRSTSIKRDIPLPANFQRYKYVEVARAIPDLDSDHSGISLLRARVLELAPDQ